MLTAEQRKAQKHKEGIVVSYCTSAKEKFCQVGKTDGKTVISILYLYNFI